ncbi:MULTISPECIES: NUDIX domain-containing protein [unclassified Oceanispirochaeta]|uniref:NUDIX domain-containing protein n=1 Tax=unclassified Oceanispirochaeta TaxID=2635722 RepID=UPI000E09CEC2|nr:MULTISPECIES: NUDIX domain-containing protein [unclassified Oceanispirochaeta]MBF9018114.1 NUDIX domain-containing protein [Oceanispirochaeta sp. M2]NPD74578.1 NUDIX domain-containing protein [Oceanispirochaeta sp. M1]RDG29607.1 NUDIX domain-containing protein [Oceanispirochaeta sp. M1]
MRTFVGAAIILYDPFDREKILLDKRSKMKKSFASYWELPGGEIEDFETPEECIHREILEELGTDIMNLTYRTVDMSYDNGNRFINFIFEGNIDLEMIQSNSDEIEEYEMIKIKSLSKYKTCHRVKEVLNSYLEN